MEIHDQLIEKIRTADRSGARQLLTEWAARHGYANLIAEIVEPALQQIGDEWRTTGTFTVAQAYIAAKVAEDMLTEMANHSQTGLAPLPTRGPVVIGNIEEDFHALGRRMVGTFLLSNGWDVRDLGNDVLPVDFVDCAVECGARVIGVSAMMLTTARNIRALRQEIDRRGLTGRLQLAVGGAVFLQMPGLVAEVGGDGTSSNALGAVKLFEELWQRSVDLENGL
jgi:methanogenic corrinoid protein MtbC1